jgi:hypothetical protein
MGFIGNMDPEDLDNPLIPSAIYEATIQTVKDGITPEGRVNAGHGEILWVFQLDDPAHPELSGCPVYERTSYAKGQGKKFKQFVTALGFEVKDFGEEEANGLAGEKCKIQVEQYDYMKGDAPNQTKETGHRVREVFGL